MISFKTFATAAVTSGAFVILSGVAVAATPSNPRVIGTPSVRYSFAKTDDSPSRFLSIGVVFRTDRVLDRSGFATIAGTTLRAGQTLPGGLFGGTSLGHVGLTRKHCYVTEVTQVRRHTTLNTRTWKFALRHDGKVIGPVKNITLRRQTSKPVGEGWELVAAKRLGC